MNNLFVGLAVLLALGGAMGILGFVLSRRLAERWFVTIFILLVAATLLFAALWHGRLVMARVIPLSNVIVLGNWIPLGAAVVMGAMLGRKSIALWRRVLIATALGGIAAYSVVQPLWGRQPDIRGDIWSAGVLLQSNRADCSSAAAATLLRAHGIDTSEREMAELCLTNTRGTPTLGLYRGLKLKTAETKLEVQPFQSNVDQLLAADRWPALLLVRLDAGDHTDSRYEKEWGWTPGVGHAVVVFGRTGNDRIDVGDPSIGREQWTIDDLRVLWHGEGIRLTLNDE